MSHFISTRTASQAGSVSLRFLWIVLILVSLLTIQHAAHASFSGETVSGNGTNLTYKASFTGTWSHYHVFFDTDNNASTGYSVTGIGADYMIEDTTLYKYSGSGGTNWGWTAQSATVTQTFPASGTVQYVLPLSGIGSPTTAKIAFAVGDANYNWTYDPTVVTYSTTPSAPTGLTASPGNTQVTLSWNASSGAASYNIYRGTSSGGESSTAIATGVTTTSYTNTGLGNGTTYYFKVKAVNSAGTSSYSNEASAAPVAGTAYYVNPSSGSDSSSGTTSGAPFQTISKAMSKAVPGTTIYLEAGTYAPFTVNISGSSSGGYITFTNYGGTATIDGTGWTASYDQGLVEIQNQNYIKIVGLNIQNGNSTTTSGSNPVGLMVEGSGSYIQILNNTIHAITTVSGGNAHGILVRGDSSSADIDNVLISGNQLYSLKTGDSESCTLTGDVTNFTLSNNSIYNNNNIGIDVEGFYGYSPLNDQARNGEINNNTVYNCSTYSNYGYYSCAGIYVDGGTAITAEDNTVYSNDIGVECESEIPGKVASNVTVRNNLIYNNTTSGIKFGGYSSGVGGASNCAFVNNTLYGNNSAGWSNGDVTIGWYATGNIFENNIVYTSSSNTFVVDIANDGASVGTVDYNDYYSSGGAASSKWAWTGPTAYTGFSSWQSSSHQDAHSVYLNPLFTSVTTPNFNLTTGSPALNTGNYGLGSSVYGTVDFAGNARTKGSTIDMGAYEN